MPLTLEWVTNVTGETEGSLHETVLGGFNFEDIDGDGVVDILICRRKDEDRIICLAGNSGEIQWIYPPMDQDGLPGDPMCVPAIDDLDGDGKLEAVLIGRSAWVHCIDGNGQLKWSFTPLDGSDHSVTINDVDEDGKKEVFFATGGNGWVYCLEHDGTERWKFQMTGGTNSGPTAWDVDRDGDVEVIVPCDKGSIIYCLSETGVEKWRFPTGEGPGQVIPVIADIDQDNEYEILVMVTDELKLYCLSFYGTEKWQFQLDPTAALTGFVSEHVALADIDGDGFIEAFVSCVRLDGANPTPITYCLNYDGSLKWTSEAIGYTHLIGDFTGDGRMNYVGGRHFWMIFVFDADGQLEYAWDHMQYDPNIPIDPGLGAPLWGPGDPKQCMGDLDGDGKIEWFLMGDTATGNAFYSFTADGAYNEENMIWSRPYRNAANVAVIPIMEGILLPIAAIGITVAIRRARP
jgi:outer membrane protein assembly factor BamB